jgi:arsenate reductase
MWKIYQYKNCDSCRKALKWLEAKGCEFQAIPIVEEPPSKAQLKKWITQSGLPFKKFFNTSGQSYRQTGLKDKMDSLTVTEAVELLAADGKLIKRPLLVADSTVLVGFKEDEYAKLL